jgi:hypothetical protein
MAAFGAARAAVPEDSWLELRYEDLVARPREQFQLLLGHLGLDWDDDFERAFATLEFTPARADAYRSELTARDVELLDAALAEALAAHGYPTGG